MLHLSHFFYRMVNNVKFQTLNFIIIFYITYVRNLNSARGAPCYIEFLCLIRNLQNYNTCVVLCYEQNEKARRIMSSHGGLISMS